MITLSKNGAWRNVGTTLGYARKDDDIFIKLVLKNKLDKDLGISIFLLGYRKDSEFSKMPKLTVNIGLNSLIVKDMKRRINDGGVQLTYKGNEVIIKIPFALLNDPAYILACVKAGPIVLPFKDTAWRIIQFEQPKEAR